MLELSFQLYSLLFFVKIISNASVSLSLISLYNLKIVNDSFIQHTWHYFVLDNELTVLTTICIGFTMCQFLFFIFITTF